MSANFERITTVACLAQSNNDDRIIATIDGEGSKLALRVSSSTTEAGPLYDASDMDKRLTVQQSLLYTPIGDGLLKAELPDFRKLNVDALYPGIYLNGSLLNAEAPLYRYENNIGAEPPIEPNPYQSTQKFLEETNVEDAYEDIPMVSQEDLDEVFGAFQSPKANDDDESKSIEGELDAYQSIPMISDEDLEEVFGAFLSPNDADERSEGLHLKEDRRWAVGTDRGCVVTDSFVAEDTKCRELVGLGLGFIGSLNDIVDDDGYISNDEPLSASNSVGSSSDSSPETETVNVNVTDTRLTFQPLSPPTYSNNGSKISVWFGRRRNATRFPKTPMPPHRTSLTSSSLAWKKTSEALKTPMPALYASPSFWSTLRFSF